MALVFEKKQPGAGQSLLSNVATSPALVMAGTFDIDDYNYAAGEDLDLRQYFPKQLMGVFIEPKGGVQFEYNHTTRKLWVKWQYRRYGPFTETTGNIAAGDALDITVSTPNVVGAGSEAEEGAHVTIDTRTDVPAGCLIQTVASVTDAEVRVRLANPSAAQIDSFDLVFFVDVVYPRFTRCMEEITIEDVPFIAVGH